MLAHHGSKLELKELLKRKEPHFQLWLNHLVMGLVLEGALTLECNRQLVKIARALVI